MKQPKSCGFLIVAGQPIESFLLMKHPNRWDLPKGHVDPGESDMECALRELEEETGIGEDLVKVDPDFTYEHRYMVKGDRYGSPGKQLEKTLLIFLGYVPEKCPLTITEHEGYEWFDWTPPHQIQPKTIDPLLKAVHNHIR